MRVWGLGFALGNVLNITCWIWKNNSLLSAKPSVFIFLFSLLSTLFIAANSISTTDMQRFMGFLKKHLLGGGSSAETDDPVEKYEFPCTMEEFGYRFNEHGELRNIQTGEPFVFFAQENDHNYNQQRYDALGELVTEHIYDFLEKELSLKRVYIPESAKKENPQSFIFMSDGALTTPDKLMLLIHGSGVVRAGQWSRKLIINEGLDKGSQIPYIRRAFEEGFEVIVLNTNLNRVTVNGKLQDVEGNETPEDHGIYVWRNFVQKAKARNIAIVAHSYGGVVTFTLADQFLEDFKERVFGIAFTDSVHAFKRKEWSAPVKQFMKERAVNFAASYVPINVALDSADAEDCCSVSAGTEEHERTSYTSIGMAFKYIRENYESWSKDGTMASHSFDPLPKDLSQFQPSNRWAKVEAAEEAEPEEKVDEGKGYKDDDLKNDKGKPISEGDKEAEEKIDEGEEYKDDCKNDQGKPVAEGDKEKEKSDPETRCGEDGQIDEEGTAAQIGKKIEMMHVHESRETKEGDATETKTNSEEVKAAEAVSLDAVDEVTETPKMKTDGHNALEMKTNRMEVTETKMDKEEVAEASSVGDAAKGDLQNKDFTQSLETDRGNSGDVFSSEEGQKQSPSCEDTGEAEVKEKQVSAAGKGDCTEETSLPSIKSEL